MEMVSVGYNGQQFEVPAEILALNATQPGVVASWIEDQQSEASVRQEQRKAKVDSAVDDEFKQISVKLKKVDRLEAEQTNLLQVVESYSAANEALKAQVEALESSGADAGSASAEARKTAYDLANASTIAHGTLMELVTAKEQMQTRMDRMETLLAEHEAKFEAQAQSALKAGQTRQRLQQEASNAALKKAYDAEAVARKAEAVAAKAERDAESAQLITDRNGSLDAGKVQEIVRAEVQASAPGAVELAVEAIRRDEFPDGFMAQRVDGDRTRQLRSDATRMIEESTGKKGFG